MTTRRRPLGARTFGILLCVYVWSLLGIGAYQEVSAVHPGVFHLWIPGHVRGSLWIGTAAVALVLAWSRRLSSIGISFLAVMPLLQMLSYGASWILHKIPGGNPGFDKGWYSSALYLAMIGLVVVIALIPSPPVKQVPGAPVVTR